MGGGGGHMSAGSYGGHSGGGYSGHSGGYSGHSSSGFSGTYSGHSSGGSIGGHSYSGQSHGNFSQPYHGSATGTGHAYSGNWDHGHSGDWNHGHAGDWNHGQWNHNWAWWHHGGPYWYGGWGGWGFGFDWPWYGYAWWPGYYDYCYGVPYAGDGYVAAAYNPTPYAAYMPIDAGPDVTAPGAPTDEAAPQTGAEPGGQFDFYGRAVAAFAQGEFGDATRLAAHAAVDDPRSQKVHLLLSLGLFATGEFRGAAIEAHAVAAIGKVPDWATVYGLYNNVDAYTTHLRALEKFVREKPTSAEGRFVLGFQYLMAGHRDEARDEFLKALKLAPKDRLAAQLLKEAGGTVPPEIAKQLAELPPPQKTFAPKLPQPPAPQAPPTK
jgi:tetratricopeptide (TPR) repeat protein